MTGAQRDDVVIWRALLAASKQTRKRHVLCRPYAVMVCRLGSSHDAELAPAVKADQKQHVEVEHGVECPAHSCAQCVTLWVAGATSPSTNSSRQSFA